jgi:membrane-associated phospholipid phosphatase
MNPNGWRSRGAELLLRLRPEELTALAFLLPTTWLTLEAERYARAVGSLGARYPGGAPRLAATVLLLAALAAALRRWPASRLVQAARDVTPFVACILIYTNLHDTIGFVNPHDVHDVLIRIDQALFGVQPSIWAEQFVTRERTELMSLCYASFAAIAPAVSLVSLVRGRFAAFRRATLAVVTCFFLGYALYVLFPAAPPRLVLATEYERHLVGYPNRLFRMTQFAIELLPVDSRAAFPSLHAAVSLVALVMAWRYWRPGFVLMVPAALGLWASTIYLRHHYAVDLLAGWALAPVAIAVAPRVDAWWAARQRARGIAPARGAPGADTSARAGNSPARAEGTSDAV